MADIFENKLFLLLKVILQPEVYVISLEYRAYYVALAIPWSILILYIIWNRKSLKTVFMNRQNELK